MMDLIQVNIVSSNLKTSFNELRMFLRAPMPAVRMRTQPDLSCNKQSSSTMVRCRSSDNPSE